MDWDHLRYVRAIVREGNLSRAAALLGVTRTTVGRRLNTIESTLGVRLFDRTPEGFVPTAAGQDMSDVAASLEGAIHALERRILGRDIQLKGQLRVSTADLQFACVHQAFASFAARYPGVELTVSMSSRSP